MPPLPATPKNALPSKKNSFLPFHFSFYLFFLLSLSRWPSTLLSLRLPSLSSASLYKLVFFFHSSLHSSSPSFPFLLLSLLLSYFFLFFFFFLSPFSCIVLHASPPLWFSLSFTSRDLLPFRAFSIHQRVLSSALHTVYALSHALSPPSSLCFPFLFTCLSAMQRARPTHSYFYTTRWFALCMHTRWLPAYRGACHDLELSYRPFAATRSMQTL